MELDDLVNKIVDSILKTMRERGKRIGVDPDMMTPDMLGGLRTALTRRITREITEFCVVSTFENWRRDR